MSGYQIIDIGSHEFDAYGALPDGQTLIVKGVYEAIEGSTKPIVLYGEIAPMYENPYFSRIKLPCFVTPHIKNGKYIIPLISYGKGEFDYLYVYLEITPDDEVTLVQDYAV